MILAEAHVHFLVVPLPPGMPYEEQQSALFRKGVLRMTEEDGGYLAECLRARLSSIERR